MMEPTGTGMDFEYLPATVVFDDWESITSSITGEPSPHLNQAQQGWGMNQYFNDPRNSS
jgi:hypothetical protein